jgi:L,D-transpeptidase YcbB
LRKSRRDHAKGEAIVFRSYSFSTRGVLAFVGPIAGGTIALAAACTLAMSAPLAVEPLPAQPVRTAMYASTELNRLLDSAPGLVVAGKRLNVGLLRRFYARHGFAPIWTTRQAQANSLLNAVSRAGDHGLAPELFHINLLTTAALQPLERELLLSDAFLSYADALARGAVPIERRRDDEALTPEPVDVAAVLDLAIGSPDPATVIETLAPNTPTYWALRQALQSYRSGISADKATNRLRQIYVNLERERWLPRRLPPDRVWVNGADARLVLYRANRPVFSTRVIVGQDSRPNQTPEFQVAIDGVLFNPPWNIPGSIATEEILPKLSRDPEYLTRRNIVMLPNGGLQQRPGPNAALGQIKFEMENRFDVYLHDTPSKNLFSRDNRRISHGCIRVENPRELAALLMQQPIDKIDQVIATGTTDRIGLPAPVTAFVVYQTAFVDIDGTLQFRADIYNRDAEVWAYLHPVQQPAAVRESPGQRRG